MNILGNGPVPLIVIRTQNKFHNNGPEGSWGSWERLSTSCHVGLACQAGWRAQHRYESSQADVAVHLLILSLSRYLWCFTEFSIYLQLLIILSLLNVALLYIASAFAILGFPHQVVKQTLVSISWYCPLAHIYDASRYFLSTYSDHSPSDERSALSYCVGIRDPGLPSSSRYQLPS